MANYLEGLQSLESDEFDVRNCPTPQLTFPDADDLLGSLDLDLFASSSSPSYQSLLNMGECDASTRSPAALSAVEQQAHLQSFADMPSASFANQGPSFGFPPNNISDGFASREDDNKTPFLLDASYQAANEGGARGKEKSKAPCQSRNAILARENREKKKNEHNMLKKKVDQLEQENASLKKKCNEFKESYKKVCERNQYLEAVIANIPQLVNLVDHFHQFTPTVAGSKGSSKSKT